jgi:hypothetical protein
MQQLQTHKHADLRMPKIKGTGAARTVYREKIWDHAAGVAIVEAAGGKCTDARGNALDFTQGITLALNEGVIVSGGGDDAHARLIAAIGDVLYPVAAGDGGDGDGGDADADANQARL